MRAEAGRALCPRCREGIPLAGEAPRDGIAPSRCFVCGSGHLYWQKDFDQRVGCAIVAVGALLVPWTYGLSLAVLSLADLLLYRLLPRVSVCYVCKVRYRGVPPRPDHAPFDLVTAQICEARAIRWADGTARPAFAPGEEPNSASNGGEAR